MRSTTHAAVLIACVALGGCDKLKGAVGKGDDAGAKPSLFGEGVLSFGNDFEGEITATVAKQNDTHPIVFAMKKPRYRVDFTGTSPNPAFGPSGSFLVDPSAKKGWILVPPQKMAMVVDFEQAKAKGGLPGIPGAPKGMPTSAPKEPPKLEKTGREATIAGYHCEVYVVKEGATVKAEVCLADGLTWIDLTDLGAGSPELALAAVATGANRFPLEVKMRDGSGVVMTVTKVDKKKLDDARFTVPPDYRIVDMAAMMGGLLGPKGLPGGNVPPR